MKIIPIVTRHFVKNEDLNHHGTLFAGRIAEWFVEAGLMTAATFIPADNIVLLNINNATIYNPIELGDIAIFTGKIVLTGKTSLVVHLSINVADKEIAKGFITFICVNKDMRPIAHGIEIEVESEEDLALQNRAIELRKIAILKE